MRAPRPTDEHRWCDANPEGCYGGIAAEIGAKNMPPACFLNAPTGCRGRQPLQSSNGVPRKG
nr:MAG TPA_asm: hypothetical protein [Caudoviricetes sp.]